MSYSIHESELLLVKDRLIREFLKVCFLYDPISGLLIQTWKNNTVL